MLRRFKDIGNIDAMVARQFALIPTQKFTNFGIFVLIRMTNKTMRKAKSELIRKSMAKKNEIRQRLGIELRHYGTANDYLIYGVEEEWLKKQGNLMAIWEEKVYRLMHSEGYLVYQAHPFRTGIRRCNPDFIDGVEIYNGKTSRECNERAEAWAKENNKLMVSGSDFHVPRQLARGGIITKKPINNNADLLDMLKSMDFEMIKTY